MEKTRKEIRVRKSQSKEKKINPKRMGEGRAEIGRVMASIEVRI